MATLCAFEYAMVMLSGPQALGNWQYMYWHCFSPSVCLSVCFCFSLFLSLCLSVCQYAFTFCLHEANVGDESVFIGVRFGIRFMFACVYGMGLHCFHVSVKRKRT